MSEQLSSEMVLAAERFAQMRELILRNEAATFGGAVVIVPPKAAGDNIELLLLDSAGDPAQFWSTIQSRITIVIENIKDKERQTMAFGRR